MIANLGSMLVLSKPSETVVPTLGLLHKHTVSTKSLYLMIETRKAKKVNAGKMGCVLASSKRKPFESVCFTGWTDVFERWKVDRDPIQPINCNCTCSEFI